MNTWYLLKKYSSDLNGIDIELFDKNIELESLVIACNDKIILHSNWGILSGRLKMHVLLKNCGINFSETVKMCQKQLHEDYYNYVIENAQMLNDIVNENRNFTFDIMAVDTLIESYLMRRKVKNGTKTDIVVCESPEQMFMRVATFLWYPDINKIKRTYNSIDFRKYIHASPTLFNAGLKKPQLASCFLLHIADSMDSISKTWNDSALISKECGGIGINLSSIRHSEIGETGKSQGITPLIKVFEKIFRYIDQGGKRKGSCAMYLADWHVDFMTFVEMKKKHIHENLRAKDLFYAAWISDLFMKRVRNNEMWSFFCPNKVKMLNETWGDEFEKLYCQYENEGIYEKQLPAKVIMFELIKAQIETGVPYLLYKDTINRKSMQSNIGIIRSSNLCSEIVLHTSEKEIASCNLASVCLNYFVKNKQFNFDELGNAVYELVENMNQVIDRTYYPEKIPEIRYANLKNRPIGIGVQGFADTLALMDMVWESSEAMELNKKIFETIYYYALRSSTDQAMELQKKYNDEYDATNTNEELNEKQKNGWYPAFPDSPYSKGILHFDLWETKIPLHYDYTQLRKDIMQFGLRNSTLIALMPTASTAHINGNNECIEPFNNMIGNRTILSGQFTIINKYLVQDLEKLELWNSAIRNVIYKNNGSINGLVFYDDEMNEIDYPPILKGNNLKISRWRWLQQKYKTVYELPQKVILDMSIGRSPFIDQTTSTNCHIPKPTLKQMYSYHFYAWKNHLKTGMYYLRTNPSYQARNIAIKECLGCS